MVGLPARGKSYITKKLARYLNWLQHDTMIFNVGERRRVAASGRPATPGRTSRPGSPRSPRSPEKPATNGASTNNVSQDLDIHKIASQMLTNGAKSTSPPSFEAATTQTPSGLPELRLPESSGDNDEGFPFEDPGEPAMDQSASFFDPSNQRAATLREQVALETLDELLDYILNQGGSVGILDATNSTLDRRKLVMQHIRMRAGNDLNVLFLESRCVDENLIERNIRLKLSGPDYKDKDPESSLEDFRKRIEVYQKAYVPLGEYEEKNNMGYVQMIDVGRKVISHQIKGFLSAQAVYYLLNFNLAPRQIWITRHGQSLDNISGKIGGDSELSPLGHRFATALHEFISEQRKVWEVHQLDKERNSHMPPLPGDHTPPNPYYDGATMDEHIASKNFCVWTSMLKRSVQTAQPFDDDDSGDYDVKQMRMLDELFAGHLEGLTYAQIADQHPVEFEARKRDKLHYRYPGPGGEGYLDVIHRLRPVIVELERMTDHALILSHRSVVRVLLAYFLGLKRDEVASLLVELGWVWCLEPKPYGVALKAYRFDDETGGFVYVPDFKLRG